MKLILEVIAGPYKGRKYQLSRGPAKIFGRNQHADESLPSDPELANHHFELRWEKQFCKLRNIPGSGGIKHNGETINEILLDDGDEFTAGSTTFRVRLDGLPSPERVRVPSDAQAGTQKRGESVLDMTSSSLPPMATNMMLNLPKYLRGFAEKLYILLDGARHYEEQQSIGARSVHQMASMSGAPYEPLFFGRSQSDLTNFGPWLVQITPETSLLEQYLMSGWGNAWGYFFVSTRDLGSLADHLRRLLMIQYDDRRLVMFRFYDPRVMRTFLPSCDATQAQFVMQGIEEILMETPTAVDLLRFRIGPSGTLITDTRPVFGVAARP